MAPTSGTDSIETSRDPAQRARQGLGLSQLALAGIATDLIVCTPVLWALARGAAVELWPADSPIALFYLLLPLLVVAGAWAAQAFGFSHARSFILHLMRTGAGAVIVILFAAAGLLLATPAADEHLVQIGGCAVVLICALHANYLGVVRSLIRMGIVEPPTPRPED